MDLIDDLLWRGLLADCTDLDALRKRVAEGPITLYCGFDPTGDSLHVGHLMGQLTLRRFQRAGHRPLPLAGGATGMIGDPSGKSAERNLLTREQLAHNVACIKGQLARLLDFDCGANSAQLVDNADWTAPLSFLDFLREVGKHFPLSAMLAKDSVKSRMGSDAGISYTEFSYQLLQAYDFYHLYQTHGCQLQIGGSDQWGNITAGVDFVRRKAGGLVWGWTFPLITKADGSKFGKTESGAVWLDPQRTSAYRFYQFFVNTEDAKVGEYLRKFTFLERPAIEALEAAHAANPGAREAQRALAREVTSLVHGAPACEAVIAASQILFGAEIGDTPEAVFTDVIAELPNAPLDATLLDGAGVALVDLLVASGLCASKGQARRDLEGGGIYVNNRRSSGVEQRIGRSDLAFGRWLLLRKGKKSYAALTAA
ncbi:MAG: tyrosine--tRNA ligase [Xanthomonadales bacterium]|nr:Tyrosine--tRNA ligase [Xanthomonadales bacterium]MCC6592748.1 tyrosine--tRNA ligase [Xanthomonadales bacterium]MCE7931251.1 tyrosine--tRNA ligase [Xanthomonadales bacterium PRO6]